MGVPHEFGGDWSDDKIDRLGRYLTAYLKIVPSRGFTTYYVDGFAGTGYRTDKARAADDDPPSYLPGLAGGEAETLRKGSARVALELEPGFDNYLFIERSRRKCTALEGLAAEFPEKAGRIRVVREDANALLQRWCQRMPSSHRAVVFLDPFGMQVEWRTLEAIAATQKIDLWLLFPLYTGVMRVLTRTEVPKEDWAAALTRTFGTEDWRKEFYAPRLTLFDDEDEDERVADFRQVGAYFIKRLETIFTKVAPNTRVYRNSKRSPLYMLCFAAGNPTGSKPAVRIANYILGADQWRTNRR